MTSTGRSHQKSFSSFLLTATILTVGASMKLVHIPAGKFMGNHDTPAEKFLAGNAVVIAA